MARTVTADISRMIDVKQKQVFMENFDSFPIEYPSFTTRKTASKKTETYDSVGNLKAAAEKQEGDAITYGKIEQAYQTEITTRTWANGFQITMESIKYDLNNVIKGAKAKELARTMRELEETNAVYWVDNAFATNLADGVPLCTNSRPLFNVPGVFNDTLTTGGITPDNIKTALQMFHRFKNHQGGPMRANATDGLTHAVNMMTVEEIMQSTLKAIELSNTKNVLPRINWHYSTYMASEAAWFLWDKSYEHILFQEYEGTSFDQDEDKISTKDMYYNAIAMYMCGTLPNIGIVGSAG